MTDFTTPYEKEQKAKEQRYNNRSKAFDRFFAQQTFVDNLLALYGAGDLGGIYSEGIGSNELIDNAIHSGLVVLRPALEGETTKIYLTKDGLSELVNRNIVEVKETNNGR